MKRFKNIYKQELDNISELKKYNNTPSYWEYKGYEKEEIFLTPKIISESFRVFMTQSAKQRIISDKHITKLRKQLKEKLYPFPALACIDNEIIDGNHRVIALFLEGRYKYPGLKFIYNKESLKWNVQ